MCPHSMTLPLFSSWCCLSSVSSAATVQFVMPPIPNYCCCHYTASPSAATGQCCCHYSGSTVATGSLLCYHFSVNSAIRNVAALSLFIVSAAATLQLLFFGHSSVGAAATLQLVPGCFCDLFSLSNSLVCSWIHTCETRQPLTICTLLHMNMVSE